MLSWANPRVAQVTRNLGNYELIPWKRNEETWKVRIILKTANQEVKKVRKILESFAVLSFFQTFLAILNKYYKASRY